MSVTRFERAALAGFRREGARCGGWSPRLHICSARVVTSLLDQGLLEQRPQGEFAVYRVTMLGHAEIGRAA